MEMMSVACPVCGRKVLSAAAAEIRTACPKCKTELYIICGKDILFIKILKTKQKHDVNK